MRLPRRFAFFAFLATNLSAELPGKSQFDRTISREVLEHYLERSITMEGMLNGRGDLDDNIRMLKSVGAKFIGRALCLWAGEANLMNKNDQNLDHYAQVLTLIRSHAAKHARRHMILLDSHVPSGGLVRDGQLLMDFHSFPLRIMETPDKPQEAILKLGFSDGIYGRSIGGMTFSGWKCDHLPYLVEIDNWGASKQPGQAKAGGIWIWGYDEITWFAHQTQQYRSNWLHYARDWVRETDTNGFLQMPGSRTLRSPLDNKRWYYANKRSPSVPDGLSDEEAIRAIWATDPAKP